MLTMRRLHMPKKPDIGVLLRKQLGDDAKVLLNKVDKMIEKRESRPKIERMIANALCDHVKKNLRVVVQHQNVNRGEC
jgi:hypothetical protein